jgi:hypothetical protein
MSQVGADHHARPVRARARRASFDAGLGFGARSPQELDRDAELRPDAEVPGGEPVACERIDSEPLQVEGTPRGLTFDRQVPGVGELEP